MESRQRIYRDSEGKITLKYAEQGKLGRYPKSMVGDEKLILALNAQAEGKEFHSFGYQAEKGPSFDEKLVDFIDGAETTVEEVLLDKPDESESMLYLDLEWEGKKYRAVKIKNYRYRSWTKRNRFALDKVYWFLYKDIEWCVQDEDEESLLLTPLVTLDSQPFSMDNATDYKVSDIRKWLNSLFLDLAFDEEEKEIILETDLGDGVIDKVFLPCYDEVGKEEGKEGEQLHPIKGFSAYAAINGAYSASSSAPYWLRTAAYNGGVEIIDVYNYRVGISNRAARDSSVCVAPAIRVKKDAFRARNPMDHQGE